jgi:Ca2+:H+ antiporter
VRLAENIKREFHRAGRQNSRNINEMPQPNGSSSESTPLLGSRNNDNANEPKWKSLPKHVANLFWATLTSNYVNFFLVFVPIGIIAGALHWNPTAVFILNFIAIIPLASLLSFATEELSAKLGQTLGGLMNATFGNAVELIVSIVALQKGEIRIVQASMLGSILSNILLVSPLSRASLRKANVTSGPRLLFLGRWNP